MNFETDFKLPFEGAMTTRNAISAQCPVEALASSLAIGGLRLSRLS